MRAFDLHRPASLEEAAAKAGRATAFKAGGIDLLDRMKERVLSPELLIDLLPLREAMGMLTLDGDTLTLGALATLAQVAKCDALQAPAFGALTRAAGEAASPQIRSRATLGGNLLQQSRCWYLRNASFACLHSGRGVECLARGGEHRYHSVLGAVDCLRVHPSSLAPALLVLDAQVLVAGAAAGGGLAMRNLGLRELYPATPLGSLAEHTLKPDEIVLFAQCKVPAAGTRTAYVESRERLGFDWATTAAAVRLRVTEGKIADAAICLGAVAPVPWPAPEAAATLLGKAPGRELFEQAAARAYAPAVPLPGNAYKIPVGKAVLVDALMEAAGLS